MIITIPASKKEKWLKTWYSAHTSGDPVGGERLISMLLGVKGFKKRRVKIYNKFGKGDLKIGVTEDDGLY